MWNFTIDFEPFKNLTKLATLKLGSQVEMSDDDDRDNEVDLFVVQIAVKMFVNLKQNLFLRP